MDGEKLSEAQNKISSQCTTHETNPMHQVGLVSLSWWVGCTTPSDMIH